jgi:hypothetical protein
MNKLEEEVGKFLRILEREEGHSFKIFSQHHLEGASGKDWRMDFVIKDFGEVKYLVECKNVESLRSSTFNTQMRRAYTELCDLLLKLNDGIDDPTVIGIVVVPAISYIREDDDRWSDVFDSWWSLFKPINAKFFNLDMFKDEEFGILGLIRGI